MARVSSPPNDEVDSPQPLRLQALSPSPLQVCDLAVDPPVQVGPGFGDLPGGVHTSVVPL
jgi:hypothetical protein